VLEARIRPRMCWSKTSVPGAGPNGLQLGAHPGSFFFFFLNPNLSWLRQGLHRRPLLRYLNFYETVAQCAAGARLPTGSGTALPRVSRWHWATATRQSPRHRYFDRVMQRQKTGKGQKVSCCDARCGAELCRVKPAGDQQRLDKIAPRGIPAISSCRFTDVVAPRRQRRRRPSRLGLEMLRVGNRPERLHLLHHSSPFVGADHQSICNPQWSTLPPT